MTKPNNRIEPTGDDAGAAPEVGFRGPVVCKVVGITYRQLDYWTRTGLVKASVACAKGSGSQRLYSYTDLVELKVVKGLLDSGMTLKKARRAIEYLRDHLGEDVASAHLVVEGGRSVLARSGDQLVDLLREGQGVLNIMSLGTVVAELDAKILEIAPSASGADGEPAEPPGEQAAAAGG